MRECFSLLEEMQKAISQDSLLERPKDGLPSGNISDVRPISFACKFYGITPIITPTETITSTVPLSSVFDSYASISLRCAQVLVEKSGHPENPKEVLSRTFSLMNVLIARLKSPMKVVWKPKEWLSSILVCFSSDVSVYCY
jgi:hypothetical protein